MIELVDVKRFCRVVISKPRKCKVHGDNVLGAKSRLDGENAYQAAAEKSRADQQHQRNCELTRNDRLAESLRALPANLFTAPFGEGIADITTGRATSVERPKGHGH